MTSPVTVQLYFNEGRPGQQGPPGPDGEVPGSRKISTGPGLSGGGDLSADRTLAADFGTTAGTVTEGDDHRLAGVPIVTESGSVTLDASHAGVLVECTSSSAQTVTVPDAVFTAGQIVEVMQYGTGQVTIAAGSGVTLREGGKGLKVADQYGSVSILFLSASEAIVTGGVA